MLENDDRSPRQPSASITFEQFEQLFELSSADDSAAVGLFHIGLQYFTTTRRIFLELSVHTVIFSGTFAK